MLTTKTDYILSTESFGIVAAIATAVGVFVAFVTFYYQRRQDKFGQLIEVFKLLNDEKHRVARRVVYQYYQGGEGAVGTFSLMDLGFPRDTPKGVIIDEYKQMVKGDFEQIGSLIKNKLLPKKAFLDAHWTTVLYSWKALKNDIEVERKKRGNLTYMQNFEDLEMLAESHWVRKYPDVKIEIY